MGKDRIVIALGGNAISRTGERGTTEEQLRNVDLTARQIAQIARMGDQPVITHGNGPQVGALQIQQEEARDRVPPQSLAVCGAMSQGWIGWMLQNRLAYHLGRQGVPAPVCTVVTQVEVSSDDPDFSDPSKPVGPFYTEEEALRLAGEKGYRVKEVKPGAEKGWRRVVPSPEPQAIVESRAINVLIDGGAIVIASGGGGIPVRRGPEGDYDGVDAVIDKDRAAFRLAQAVGAKGLLILTDVEKVYLYFNSPRQQPLDRLSAEEAERYLREGHFLSGSMQPKVEAAVRFARWSGREAIVSSLDRAMQALRGETGTRIRP
jgi:carbamate kinase